MTLDAYLARRRRYEFLLVVGFVLTGFVANSVIVSIEMGRGGRSYDIWLPWALEGSSHLALLLMFPLVLWFDSKVPIRLSNWRRALSAHAAFSVVFSLGHVGLMYAFRQWTWPLFSPGRQYGWEHWPLEFAFEYLKDFRTYLMILALVYLYRFILRRIQGEAELVDEGEDPDEPPTTSERFLVKKLGREFLVRTNDIDWIEACGNYVNLHVGKRVYPLRDTMMRIDERLSGQGFQRVHRSAIVNLERIVELSQTESGEGAARLSSDVTVPVSRSYRKVLRERL
jgi:DNA-binding LytR/AlgR family response regulator